MPRAHSLVSLSLAACTQTHLSIGSVDADNALRSDASIDAALPDSARSDATVSDSALATDTRPDGSTGPLTATLRAFGRDDIQTLVASCNAPCADFDVVVEGGIPPYRVAWPDGVQNGHRTFCPGADALTDIGIGLMPVTVTVSDATPVQTTSIANIVLDTCSDPDAGVSPSWSVCFRPALVADAGCTDSDRAGLWYDVGAPLAEDNVTFQVGLGGFSLFTSAYCELHVTSAICGADLTSTTGTLTYFASALSSTPDASQPPARNLLLRCPDGAGGAPPAGLTVGDVQVCFDR